MNFIEHLLNDSLLAELMACNVLLSKVYEKRILSENILSPNHLHQLLSMMLA